MTTLTTIEGDFLVPDGRFALLAARFNDFIVTHLVDGAADALKRHGIKHENIHVVRTPGSYELPLAAKKLAASGRYDGIVALGAVIRGSTPHFDYVAGECTKGLGQIALQYDLPIGFGVLTVDTIEQAIERAGTKAGNKGFEAAMTVLEMASLLRHIESSPAHG